jgi:hypothetical protein
MALPQAAVFERGDHVVLRTPAPAFEQRLAVALIDAQGWVTIVVRRAPGTGLSSQRRCGGH